MKLLHVLFLLFPISIVAQDISGRVVNTDKHYVDNAIISKSDGEHTHTDLRGQFVISGKPGDSLMISKVGFRTITMIVPIATEWIITLSESGVELNEVEVANSIRTFKTVSAVDLNQHPVNSSQELLRKVPGLFIGQHAGGGKAEQIFLRGFDIDHGTDIALDVDGMPVNMVSHGHGHGYADLHFVIPETVDKIDFDKGPYYADKGNLATAGYVSFRTKNILEKNVAGIEVGNFNTFRALTMFNLVNGEQSKAYIASEFLKSDGPFISPQNFNRINLFGKYTYDINDRSQFSVSLSHFKSKWDASGQIPERAISNGTIGWFGSIDDTEGGETSRTNAVLKYNNLINHNTTFRNTLYYSKYDFELFSNFTFFLEDPVNGDQIRQRDLRAMFGLESAVDKHYHWNNNPLKVTGAVGFRNDDVSDLSLSRTANRTTILEDKMIGRVNETNIFAYINSEFRFGRWLINPGVRVDYFDFEYQDKLSMTYETQSESKAVVSPKLNFLYTIDENLNVYLKTGKGFHSNDTRVVVAQQGRQILPSALGADIGISWKPFKNLMVNVAGWYLQLDQEFVYVGDAAIVEPSGETARKGLDLGIRYSFLRYFYFNSDLNFTHARSINEPIDENYIPLAANFTTVNGLSFKHPSGLSFAANTRYLADRPANEDYSLVAKGYCITDLNASFLFRNGIEISVLVQNLFDVKWKETQFATESRLQNETAPVDEIHFTPGTPFNLRAVLVYRF